MFYRFIIYLTAVLLFTGSVIPQPKFDKKQCPPEALRLFGRMVEEPPDSIKSDICRLIRGLIDSAIWKKLDCFYILAAGDTNQAHLNWIQNKHNLTPLGNMTFEQYRGYQGDGLTSFLETHYNPLADGHNYMMNYCGAGIYSRTDTYELGDKADMGSGGKPPYIWINFKGTPRGLMRAFLNSTSSSGSIYNYAGSTAGIISVNRTTKDSVSIYTTTTTGSTSRVSKCKVSSIPAYSIWISGKNDGKMGTAFQNRQYAAAFIGGALTQKEHNSITLLIETYLDSVGAGVLP